MRKAVDLSLQKLESSGDDEDILGFHDIPSTLAFLRCFKNDPIHLASLRAKIAANFHNLSRLNTEEMLKVFASMLVRRRIKILRLPLVSGGLDQQAELEAQAQMPPRSAPPKKSWIEINLVDAQGQPVAAQRYRIKLPDGTVEERNLDEFGHAEYYDINPGTCEIAFPDMDDEEWDLKPVSGERGHI